MPESKNGDCKSEEVKPELNSINYRHTYHQDCIRSDAKTSIFQPNQFPRNTLLRGKGLRTRPMRLRPRQVFCTKCKSVCTENSENVKNATNPSAVSTVESDNLDKKQSVDGAFSTPKKLRRIHSAKSMYIHRQESPIIKISFSNPEGKGTVMKIARRSQSYSDDLKSAALNGPPLLSSEHGHRKRAKHHHKHKVKRKKRHRHQSGLENSDDSNFGSAPILTDHSSSYSSMNSNAVQLTEARVNLKRLPDSEISNITPGNNEDREVDDEEVENEDDASNDEDDIYDEASNSTTGSNSSYGSCFSQHRRSRSSSVVDDPLCTNDGPRQDCSDEVRRVKPLMMRIQSHAVDKCVTPKGKAFSIDDIVWGKIHGFPWWPGRIVAISESLKDNGSLVRQLAHVAWFASTTSSMMCCSDLLSFSENFHHRFNKKKKGTYKEAIRQAMLAAQANAAQLQELDILS